MVPQFGLEVSPALVSFAELLMLPYPAMQLVVEQELCNNAALERVDGAECPICRGVWPTRCPVCATSPDSRGSGSHLEGGDFTDTAATECDTQALLRAARLETRSADAAIVEYLVESLDRHGLLDRSCSQLACELGVDESVVARDLNIIQRAGPPGVGATSASECLLLQLDALGLQGDVVELARAVIAEHLPALAQGRFASIASALGVAPAEIREVLALIRQRLRPHPAFDGNATAARRYVVPDVVVRHHQEIAGEFVVDLVEPAMTRLAVRPIDRGQAAQSRSSANMSVPQAKSFLARLRDRWETLRRVAEYAVERQKGFLVEGAAALVPLTRAEVAAMLDLHESTVSRTVADKYVLLTDRTIVPLACFFTVSGGVDETMRKLIESAEGPISDQRLAEQLRDAGYSIARRTVAKHRARLGITAASLR
jgi:RNA polymerase sigma-54 factor